MFLSHTGPWSYPTCSFHWVGEKVERENPSNHFIPWGNSHPSSCHQAVTSFCFQPHVALGTWVQQDLPWQMPCISRNIAKLHSCASLSDSWNNPSVAIEVLLVFLWYAFCQFPLIPLWISSAMGITSHSNQKLKVNVRCPSEPAEPSQFTSAGVQPHVCAHCWVDAAGMGIPLVLNSQRTADSGSSDHLSHQPCQGRTCLSCVRKPFALSQHQILLVSHAVAPPGGVIAESVESSSADSGRCKFWFMLYYRKSCEVEAGFSFSSDSFLW